MIYENHYYLIRFNKVWIRLHGASVVDVSITLNDLGIFLLFFVLPGCLNALNPGNRKYCISRKPKAKQYNKYVAHCPF